MIGVRKDGVWVRKCDLCGHEFQQNKDPKALTSSETYYIELGIGREIGSNRQYNKRCIGKTSSYEVKAVTSICEDCFNKLIGIIKECKLTDTPRGEGNAQD